MKWSRQQEQALDAVGRWFRSQTREKPVFRCFGFAGVGKTTLARHFAEGINTIFASFTGKAAHVMRKSGCDGATTIHSLIYNPKDKSRARLRQLEKQYNGLLTLARETFGGLKSQQMIDLETDIKEERRRLQHPSFELKSESDLEGAELLIVDECFVGVTSVDTPTGPQRIDRLQPGDRIINATGIDRVVATARRKEKQLAKVYFEGKTVYCSRSHPFFTSTGVKSAGELELGDQLLSASSAMRLLRHNFSASNRLGQILRAELRDPVDQSISRVEETSIQRKTCDEYRQSSQEMVGVRRSPGRSRTRSDPQAPPLSLAYCATEDQQKVKGNRSPTVNPRWQWSRADQSSKNLVESTGQKRMGPRICSSDRPERSRNTYELQNRFSAPGQAYSNRGRRRIPWHASGPGSRPQENGMADGPRVDGVEILESGDSELDQFRNADGQLYLYDLQIAQHPSFSVEGCLVHNCSMVDRAMADHLVSFGTPILVLGDPAQLAPVFGAGAFTARPPDIMLTEIHRQARDNPIIDLATRIRERKHVHHDGKQVVHKADWTLEHERRLEKDVQFIVGRNKTRRNVNHRVRGRHGHYDLLSLGERLVCLKNNHKLGLLNGSIWTLINVQAQEDEDGVAEIMIENDDGLSVTCEVTTSNLRGTKLDYNSKRGLEEFDYGWALTCHKSQGSGWDEVVIYDESFCFDEPWRWRYTAVTRAIENVVLVTE